MAGINKYANLKSFPFVAKTMKFKQARLMKNVVADDVLLQFLLSIFMQLKIDRTKWEEFLANRGACSIFSARWLSEVFGVSYAESIREPDSHDHGLAVAQCMARNAYLQQREAHAFLGHLLRLHGLMGNPEPLKLNELPPIAYASGSYFIACEGGDCAHAIAYSDLQGGMFFDPNAGEYTFVNALPAQKSQFLAEWVEINKQGPFVANYAEFSCYRVARARHGEFAFYRDIQKV